MCRFLDSYTYIAFVQVDAISSLDNCVGHYQIQRFNSWISGNMEIEKKKLTIGNQSSLAQPNLLNKQTPPLTV
jgi:hypothetical protein